jgi:alkylation response protein AidB-like acyl-CoA dehydrogenase
MYYRHFTGKGTATLALPSTDGQYDLYGYKWFTSATDSDMALTLARDTDASGQPLDTGSSKGLSMFFLKVPGIALRLKSQLTLLG